MSTIILSEDDFKYLERLRERLRGYRFSHIYIPEILADSWKGTELGYLVRAQSTRGAELVAEVHLYQPSSSFFPRRF